MCARVFLKPPRLERSLVDDGITITGQRSRTALSPRPTHCWSRPGARAAFVSLLSPGTRQLYSVAACVRATVFFLRNLGTRRRRRPGFCFPDDDVQNYKRENIILLIETRCACAAATTHRDRQLFTKHCFVT